MIVVILNSVIVLSSLWFVCWCSGWCVSVVDMVSVFIVGVLCSRLRF